MILTLYGFQRVSWIATTCPHGLAAGWSALTSAHQILIKILKATQWEACATGSLAHGAFGGCNVFKYTSTYIWAVHASLSGKYTYKTHSEAHTFLESTYTHIQYTKSKHKYKNTTPEVRAHTLIKEVYVYYRGKYIHTNTGITLTYKHMLYLGKCTHTNTRNTHTYKMHTNMRSTSIIP